jgi:hypothetical protein
LTLDEILRHLIEERTPKGVAHPEVFDATQARTDATGEQVRVVVQRMIDMHRQGAFCPTAVITNNDVLFGMASMLGILSELGVGQKFKPFAPSAKGWIGW